MLKKPQIVGILFIIAVFALFSASTQLDENVEIQSKKSHAEKEWKTSGHAASGDEAFRHWDEDDPPLVSRSCAKCHSRHGFVDFITDGTVDSPAGIDTTVDCLVCHTSEEGGPTRPVTSVTFPSGVEVEDLGPEAICMTCHQGRQSSVSVNSHIAAAGAADDDTISSRLSFRNIHYYAASATQFGTVALGGYQYAGKSYDARFSHVDGYNACQTCHNPHTLEIKHEQCATCHIDPKSMGYWAGVDDPKNIRFYGSFVDYDGDGDMKEGMYYEIDTLKNKLYATILSYAEHVNGKPIVYDSHTYPYFFNDSNGNGIPDPSEANYGNQYRSWTPRLLRAAYNYQVTLKDPGGFAHGGKYLIELLYDSMEDLNSKLAALSPAESNSPGRSMTHVVSMAGMHRTDEGHFDGSAEAWRHEDGEVSTSCATCHSANGLGIFLQNGTITSDDEVPPANGMLCTTCHTSPPGLRMTSDVKFPSGEYADLGDASNLCMQCHQGRASKLSIDSKIAGSAGPYTFTNIHYFPTAAVLFGNEVHGGYEFAGKTYAGQRNWPNHNGLFDTCIECHMGSKSPRRSSSSDMTVQGISNNSDHNVLKPNQADCVYCHGQDVSQPNPGADPTKFKFSGIRPASTIDYNGNGNRRESLKNEIRTLEAALYAQIQAYGFAIGAPVIYDSHSYPYFFKDTNGNGLVDPGEANYGNRYMFDAKILRAAYNYQMSLKEPHGYIHNSRYVAQLLVDSIEHLGGDVSAYTWR